MKFLKIIVTYFVTLFFCQELQSHVIHGNDQLSVQRNSKNKHITTNPNKEQDLIRLRLNRNNVVKDRLKPKTIVHPQNLAVAHRIGKTPPNDRKDKGKTKSTPQIAVDIQLPMVIRKTKMPSNNVKQTESFDIIDAPAKDFYIEDASTLSKTNVELQIEKPISKINTQETEPKPSLKENKDLKQHEANKADFVPNISTQLKELDLKSNEIGDNYSLVPDEIDNKLPVIKLTEDVKPHRDIKIDIVAEKQLISNKTVNEIPIFKLSTENKSVNETKKGLVLSSENSPQNKSHTTECEKNKIPIDENKQSPNSIKPNTSFTTTNIDRVDNGTMDLICIKQHNYTEVIERHSGNPSKLQTSDHKIYYNTPNANYYPFHRYEELIRNVTHEDPFTPDFTYIQPSYEFPNVDKVNAKNWEIKTTATHEKSKSTVDDDNPVTTVKSWYNSEVTIRTSRDNTPAIVEIEPNNINAATKDVTHYYKPSYYEEEVTNHYKPTSFKENLTNHCKPTSYKGDFTNQYEPTSYIDVTKHNKPTSIKEDVTNHYEPTSYKGDVTKHYEPTSYKGDDTNHYKPTSHKEDVTNHYEPTSYKGDVTKHYEPTSFKGDDTNHYKPTSHKEDVTNHYEPNRNKVDPVNYDTHYASHNYQNAFYGGSGRHYNNKNNRYINIPEPSSCSYYPCYLYPTYNYTPNGKYI